MTIGPSAHVWLWSGRCRMERYLARRSSRAGSLRLHPMCGRLQNRVPCGHQYNRFACRGAILPAKRGAATSIRITASELWRVCQVSTAVKKLTTVYRPYPGGWRHHTEDLPPRYARRGRHPGFGRRRRGTAQRSEARPLSVIELSSAAGPRPARRARQPSAPARDGKLIHLARPDSSQLRMNCEAQPSHTANTGCGRCARSGSRYHRRVAGQPAVHQASSSVLGRKGSGRWLLLPKSQRREGSSRRLSGLVDPIR